MGQENKIIDDRLSGLVCVAFVAIQKKQEARWLVALSPGIEELGTHIRVIEKHWMFVKYLERTFA